MNVYYNGGVVFNMKLDEVSCFYFCDHFYKAFKKKQTIKGASILRSHPAENVIAYCSNCCKKIRKISCQLESLSYNFFAEAKKKLIQYYPLVKGVYIIDNNCLRL